MGIAVVFHVRSGADYKIIIREREVIYFDDSEADEETRDLLSHFGESCRFMDRARPEPPARAPNAVPVIVFKVRSKADYGIITTQKDVVYFDDSEADEETCDLLSLYMERYPFMDRVRSPFMDKVRSASRIPPCAAPGGGGDGDLFWRHFMLGFLCSVATVACYLYRDWRKNG